MVKIRFPASKYYEFMIHEARARAISALIQRIVEEQPESEVVTIELDTDTDGIEFDWRSKRHDIRIFDAWVTWLYKKNLLDDEEQLRLECTGEYGLLLVLYELGTYLEDDKFQKPGARRHDREEQGPRDELCCR